MGTDLDGLLRRRSDAGVHGGDAGFRRREPEDRGRLSQGLARRRRAISRTIRRRSPTSSSASTPTRATPCRAIPSPRRWRASRSIPAFPTDLKPYMQQQAEILLQSKISCDPGLEQGAAPGFHGACPRQGLISAAVGAPRRIFNRRVKVCPLLKEARSPRAINPSPGISSCWRTICSAASAAWAKACRCRSRRTAGASSGWRMKARRRISPRVDVSPIRASRKWWCRPTCRTPICARIRSRPAGNMMAVAYQTSEDGLQPAGFELFDISVPENPKSIALLRLLRAAFARRASVVVLRRRIRPYARRARATSSRPMRSTTSSIAASTCAIRQSRSKSAAGGCPAPRQGDNVMPPARHPIDKGFRAHNTNVYPQRPDRCYLAYIDGGMFVLDISDKANPKKISQWTNSPPYTGFMHTDRAAVRPRPDAGDRRIDREQRQGLAEADLGARRARRDQSGFDRRPARCAGPRPTRPRRPLRRAQHPRERAAADVVALRPDRARHVLQRRACAPTTSPIRISRRRSASSCRRRRPARRPARSRSTTFRRRARHRLYRRPAHRWRWIFILIRATNAGALHSPWEMGEGASILDSL